MSVATELLLKAMADEFAFVHLDTADRRGFANMGRLEPGNMFLALYHGFKCLWILLAKRTEVVYVPIAQAWLPFLRDCLFLIPARLLRRKVIVHLHGGYFGPFYRQTSLLMRQIIRFALGDADRGIVLGRSVQGAFGDVVPGERVRVVPNGIPDYFEHGAQTERKPHGPTLLFLSTLMADKGVLDVLRALPKVREESRCVRAVFAGEWFREEDQQAAQHLIQGFGLESNVEIIGPVGPPRKYELLADADVVVLPSRNEGQPYVILEAMAAGLPVISTNVGCIPEMVEDGMNGFLIEPGDVEGLAEKVCLLLADGALRRRMGQASRERFLAAFTFDLFAERMRVVFAEVLNGAKAGHKKGSDEVGFNEQEDA